MKRQTLNFVVDGFLGLLGLSVLATGLLIAYILPAHSRGATVWGWTRHDWGDLHLYLALSMIGLIVLHLILHWSWVCVVGAKIMTRLQINASPAIRWGVGLVVVATVGLVLGGFLYAAAVSKVAQPRGPGQGRAHVTIDTSQDASAASSGSAASIATPGPSAS